MKDKCMSTDNSIQQVAGQLEIAVSDRDALYQALIDKINHLLTHDFNQLISILYRMDISDKKLQQLLQQEEGQDAAVIILQLMVERQEQKIKSRQAFTQRDDTIDENEKW